LNNTQKLTLAIFAAAVAYLLVRCSIMEPSQSLSDIQTPDQAVSNAPTAESQRKYEHKLKASTVKKPTSRN